jgi:hypothetical protein
MVSLVKTMEALSSMKMTPSLPQGYGVSMPAHESFYHRDDRAPACEV